MAERFEKSSHAVDGKHPKGGSSHKLKLPSAERAERGKKYFQAPSSKSAKKKIMFQLSVPPSSFR